MRGAVAKGVSKSFGMSPRHIRTCAHVNAATFPLAPLLPTWIEQDVQL